jgi:Xaa-Pro aminopeptidase
MSLAQKIACLKKAAEIVSNIFPDIIGYIRPGRTEKDIASFIFQRIKANGGAGISFRTLVASGKRSAQVHGHASVKKVGIGDQILLDYGAVYKGYRSDISRTVFVGKISNKQRKIYALILKAQNKAVKCLKEGADCAVIDNCARKIITKAGYGKFFKHSTGHGLGFKVHELPRISTRSKAKLKAGDIVTIEPGIYIKGWGGVRIEDDYLITERGSVCLTGRARKNRPIVIKVH